MVLLHPPEAMVLPSGETARAWTVPPDRRRTVPIRARATAGSASPYWSSRGAAFVSGGFSSGAENEHNGGPKRNASGVRRARRCRLVNITCLRLLSTRSFRRPGLSGLRPAAHVPDQGRGVPAGRNQVFPVRRKAQR